LDAAEAINFDQREKFVDMIKNYFRGDLKGKTMAVWGLSFKPGTDDVREAPGLTVISRLVDAGATVKAYDPQAVTTARQELGEIPLVSYASSCYDAVKGADALVINTEWSSFREPDFERMKSLMKQPVIFDGRNLYNQAKITQLGFQYFFVGKKIEA
jgi:UDPglucose 6-dehydrogenase